ncbi:AfsA-related hotdog domain-containing protein [Streptomyces sp. NPDC050504]|uniref:AfsA-related hotdog domain-containing protein n=1 Tax=Streptomyces sp. NPDC050504 TaxID=3365618 RepID=UPI0037AB11FA
MRGVAMEPAHAADRRPADPLSWHSLGLGTMASLLVVSLEQLGGRYYEARCQWARTHPLNERTVAAVRHHPMLLAESTRQLASAVERRHLSAPGRPPLVPVSVHLGLDAAAHPVEHGNATDVAVRVVVSDLAPRNEGPTAYRLTAEYLHAGVPFGSCTMRLAPGPADAPDPWKDAGAVGALHPSAAAVGAAAEPDVLLARSPRGRLLIVPRDAGHPVFLPDRPRRLPALAVMEAGRQAALLGCGLTSAAVIGLRVELHAATPANGAEIEAVAEHGGARFAVSAAGGVTATGGVTLRCP